MHYTCYKKIDDVGRVVVPKELREALDIRLNETVKFDIEDDKIVISKADQTCIFCGRTDSLKSYRGKTVCSECIKNLNNT